MSADGVILGPEAKIDFNGVPFGTVSGDIQITRDKVQRTDTETLSDQYSGTRAKLSKLRTARINVVAHRANDQDYHLAPANFQDADGLSVTIYPQGRDDVNGSYYFPTMLIDQFTALTWNVQGSAVMEVRLQAESDGDFFAPGEA